MPSLRCDFDLITQWLEPRSWPIEQFVSSAVQCDMWVTLHLFCCCCRCWSHEMIDKLRDAHINSLWAKCIVKLASHVWCVRWRLVNEKQTRISTVEKSNIVWQSFMHFRNRIKPNTWKENICRAKERNCAYFPMERDNYIIRKMLCSAMTLAQKIKKTVHRISLSSSQSESNGAESCERKIKTTTTTNFYPKQPKMKQFYLKKKKKQKGKIK